MVKTKGNSFFRIKIVLGPLKKCRYLSADSAEAGISALTDENETLFFFFSVTAKNVNSRV